jgi:hypothetical protein
MGEEDVRSEWLKCETSEAYFIHYYCKILDAVAAQWVPFELWPAQYTTLKDLESNLLLVILKARQLGLTWLCLAHILWKMIFRPAQTALLFSRREDEAIYLLKYRLKGMYSRLPVWLLDKRFVVDSQHEWRLENGSGAYAFPTTAGDSYTASIVLVDEADLIADLPALMNAVKPTIDAGGQMILLSRSNKEEPNSAFKQYYRAAKKGENGWKAVFLPWNVRPTRTIEWYDDQKIDVLTRTGAVDDLWQQYPATDAEALAPKVISKRIPPQWLTANYAEYKGLKVQDAPTIPGLKIYQEPIASIEYVIGADPAEGNPTSDDSSCVILDKMSGEEVATFSDKFEPTMFAQYVEMLGIYYNKAELMVERNNHGHTVVAWCKEHSKLPLLKGQDGDYGWATSGKSKAQIYTTAAECFRDSRTTIHTFETYMQLASIDGSTLKAPKGSHDDRAMAYVLALQAMNMPQYKTVVYTYG